jgi:hypothetical protein
MKSKQGIGFLTFAQNTEAVDYLSLAYAQACNVKSLHLNFGYAVIVDQYTNSLIAEKHRKVFDYVIEVPVDFNKPTDAWKLSNEQQALDLTPFKETIKLEADLLFTRPIIHWLTAFRFKDIVLSHGCKNFKQETSISRYYRKFFDDNQLPDIYTGLMYFRYSQSSFLFYKLVKQIFKEWPQLKLHLKHCKEDVPSTDVLFAMAAHVYEIENCTIPTIDFVNFVHMKPMINGFENSQKWQETQFFEREGDMLRIGHRNQYHPVHYQEKDFMTSQLIEYYEKRYHDVRR